jgi:regulator of protease activity HflC (stomatin/prohibitin superfamily)
MFMAAAKHTPRTPKVRAPKARALKVRAPRARVPRVQRARQLRALPHPVERPPARRSSGPPPWALAMMRRASIRRIGTFVAALLVLALVVAVAGVRVTRGDVGTVAVVRNGGPFDSRTIRQVVMPGQGLTYIGFFSQSPHEYPASNITLKYTVTSHLDRPQPAADTLTLPTKDGVQVSIDAAVFFRFVGESDPDLLIAFDQSAGTRRFPAPDGQELYPWEGTLGFSSMLDALFRPVLENDLRVEIGRFPCAALISSCSLVTGTPKGEHNIPRVNIAKLEQRIDDSLERDLEQSLGKHFFWDVRFVVGQVTLPDRIQQAVDEAHASFTEVNTSRAHLKQARYDARANRLLGKTYNESDGLAMIEALKALPKGANVILSTGGKMPRLLANAAPGTASSTQ